MQISAIPVVSFGHKNCNTKACANKKQNNCDCAIQAQSTANLTRNAIMTAVLGILAGCQTPNDSFVIVSDKNGQPIICNQDGDCVDFVPKKVYREYQKAYDRWDNQNPNCTIAKMDDVSDFEDTDASGCKLYDYDEID